MTSTKEAELALASLLAAAFPDLSADATGRAAGLAQEAVSTSAPPPPPPQGQGKARAQGAMRPIEGVESVMLTEPAATGPIPPPTPNSRQAAASTTPQKPTRSGRVPQLPHPDDIDHSTFLFNEYLNYDWPSDDDEDDDPDFHPTSEPFSGHDIWVGEHGHGVQEEGETGDLSMDDDDEGETDFSTLEDAWMQDDAASSVHTAGTVTGDEAAVAAFSNDILINPLASTSVLPITPAVVAAPATKGRAPRTTSAAKAKPAASAAKPKGKGKGKGKQTEAQPPPPPPSEPASPPKKRTRTVSQPAPAPAPVPDAPPKRKGRPRIHNDADPVEARAQRKRDAAKAKREEVRIKVERDMARLAHLELENVSLRQRVAELERRFLGGGARGKRDRAISHDEHGSSLASGSASGDDPHQRRPPERGHKRKHHHHHHEEEDAEDDDGDASSSAESSGAESSGTIKSERIVLPGIGPPEGVSREALAELSRLLEWAAKAGAASAAKH